MRWTKSGDWAAPSKPEFSVERGMRLSCLVSGYHRHEIVFTSSTQQKVQKQSRNRDGSKQREKARVNSLSPVLATVGIR